MTVSTTTPTAANSGEIKSHKSLGRRIWEHRVDYLLISPFFIIYGIFHFFPMLWAFWLSFHRWLGIGKMRWFGVRNYERLLHSSKIWHALGNSLIFLVVMLPVIVVTTLLIASILNSRQVKGRTIFRILFFLPYITSIVIVVIIFTMLLQENFGWVNGILSSMGLPKVRWFSSPWPARSIVMIMIFWSYAGYNILIMLGGLQGIPEELYDAASIDGAGMVRKFIHVTVPMMRGVILFVSITSTIMLLNLFLQPWLLFHGTNGAGPKQATATLNTIQYATAFNYGRYGEASALGFLIGILVIAVSLLQIKFGQSDVEF